MRPQTAFAILLTLTLGCGEAADDAARDVAVDVAVDVEVEKVAAVEPPRKEAVLAKSIIIARMKHPYEAEMGEDIEVSKSKLDTTIITGTVKGMNAFGAKLTSEWLIEFPPFEEPSIDNYIRVTIGDIADYPRGIDWLGSDSIDAEWRKEKKDQIAIWLKRWARSAVRNSKR